MTARDATMYGHVDRLAGFFVDEEAARERAGRLRAGVSTIRSTARPRALPRVARAHDLAPGNRSPAIGAPATDKLTGETVRVDVTLTIVK
jgi:hypothetical protein